MAWTYNVVEFANTEVGYYTGSTIGDRYQVRMHIQDTNESRQLFQDEEIDWQLTQEANVYMAAAALCETLVSKAGGGGVKSKKVGDLRIEYDVAFYVQRAAMLRSRGCGHQLPYAGGISKVDKTAQNANTDRVQPSVFRNLDENPAAPAPTVPPANPLTTV